MKTDTFAFQIATQKDATDLFVFRDVCLPEKKAGIIDVSLREECSEMPHKKAPDRVVGRTIATPLGRIDTHYEREVKGKREIYTVSHQIDMTMRLSLGMKRKEKVKWITRLMSLMRAVRSRVSSRTMSL